MWDTAEMRRVRAIVTGRVQGVSYRATTVDEARRLGVTGWVRNRTDGSVELEAEGPPELIGKLLTWCEQGPAMARVSHVAVEELTPTGVGSGFKIAH
jgi:acylphosphatase